MLEHLFRSESALTRHRTGPFAEERERYLQHCAEHGATRSALRVKANELLWLSQHLRRDAAQGIDIRALQEIARERTSICKGASTERRLVDIGRPWLRFLGWWRAPTAEIRFQNHLERYVTWMRDERGFSSSTVVQWRSQIRDFLQWYGRTDRPLCALEPSDVDVYFATEGTRRWSRVSTSNIAAALRVFLRYMANCGECDPRVAEAIRGPRLRSEEHTSELQSLTNLVCRLLLEKKKTQSYQQKYGCRPCKGAERSGVLFALGKPSIGSYNRIDHRVRHILSRRP